ncbi:MAG: hypothetical protein HYZ74_04525 [Elusimicrobia bacterium]|nr:hypothetical protein [Elusimicrobiota bacterium]
MKEVYRLLPTLHRIVLTALFSLSVPMLLGLFLANLTPGAARAMEAVAPVWGWMMALWSASALYFLGCMAFSTGFRERLLTRIAGLNERDEREEIVTAKAARAVYLVTLAGFMAAGLLGMLRVNIFEYTRWKGDVVPPLVNVGPYQLRKGEVAKKGFVMWPSLGLPKVSAPYPEFVERERGSTQYFYESFSIFKPEVARTFFALALIQVLLLHLFARRVRV